MLSRVTLTLTVEHPVDYDPTAHFVWYFDDTAPEPLVVEADEDWVDVE